MKQGFVIGLKEFAMSYKQEKQTWLRKVESGLWVNSRVVPFFDAKDVLPIGILSNPSQALQSCRAKNKYLI